MSLLKRENYGGKQRKWWTYYESLNFREDMDYSRLGKAFPLLGPPLRSLRFYLKYHHHYLLKVMWQQGNLLYRNLLPLLQNSLFCRPKVQDLTYHPILQDTLRFPIRLLQDCLPHLDQHYNRMWMSWDNNSFPLPHYYDKSLIWQVALVFALVCSYSTSTNRGRTMTIPGTWREIGKIQNTHMRLFGRMRSRGNPQA